MSKGGGRGGRAVTLELLLVVEEEDGDGFAAFDDEGADAGSVGALAGFSYYFGFESGHGSPGGARYGAVLAQAFRDIAAAKDVAGHAGADGFKIGADNLLEHLGGDKRLGGSGAFAAGENENLLEGVERQTRGGRFFGRFRLFFGDGSGGSGWFGD